MGLTANLGGFLIVTVVCSVPSYVGISVAHAWVAADPDQEPRALRLARAAVCGWAFGVLATAVTAFSGAMDHGFGWELVIAPWLFVCSALGWLIGTQLTEDDKGKRDDPVGHDF
jgi:cytochrome bd-type quinol oxidase subunit 2